MQKQGVINLFAQCSPVLIKGSFFLVDQPVFILELGVKKLDLTEAM